MFVTNTFRRNFPHSYSVSILIGVAMRVSCFPSNLGIPRTRNALKSGEEEKGVLYSPNEQNKAGVDNRLLMSYACLFFFIRFKFYIIIAILIMGKITYKIIPFYEQYEKFPFEIFEVNHGFEQWNTLLACQILKRLSKNKNEMTFKKFIDSRNDQNLYFSTMTTNGWKFDQIWTTTLWGNDRYSSDVLLVQFLRIARIRRREKQCSIINGCSLPLVFECIEVDLPWSNMTLWIFTTFFLYRPNHYFVQRTWFCFCSVSSKFLTRAIRSNRPLLISTRSMRGQRKQ